MNNVTWWQLLIPVGASIVGWGLAMIGQAIQTGRENRREHYYKVLERTEDIFARCGALSDSVYELHEKCVKLANQSRADESILNDFITRFQNKLASIYLSQRIFYPGIKIDTSPIVKAADELVRSIREMWQLTGELSTTVEVAKFSERAKRNQEDRATIIRSFSTELGLIMNIMVVSINKINERHKIVRHFLL